MNLLSYAYHRYFFFFLAGFFLLVLILITISFDFLPTTYAQTPSATSCTFTKGDQNPKAAPYSSSLLLSYFQEASQKTGVPAAILAAIARVEATTGVYSISNYTDGDIRAMEQAAQGGNFDGNIPDTQKALCPKSPTGARGIMQIQPPGTTGNASESIENGARFLGKKASDLTMKDYCDPKTEMIIAAGFILKKMQGVGYGDATKWDPAWNTSKPAFDAAAKSYYGCLEYGDPDNPNKCVGPYNYGDDIWQSFQDCKEAFAAPINPSNANASSNIYGGGDGGSLASNEVLTKVGNPPVSSTIGPTGDVFYCQGDPRWSNTACLGSAGCGAASLAEALSSLGISMTPPDVVGEFQKHPGWYSCANGSTMEWQILPSNWLKDLGVAVAPICGNCGRNLNTTFMKEYADKGYVFIASSHEWPCVSCVGGGHPAIDHIVMLTGADPVANTVFVNDPNNCNYANGQEYDTNKVRPASSINWAYVYALKKI